MNIKDITELKKKIFFKKNKKKNKIKLKTSNLIDSNSHSKRLLDKLNSIKNEIKKSKNLLIFFDTDADGLTSFLQIKKYFNNNITIKGIPFYRYGDKHNFFNNKINYDNFDTILFLDIPYFEWIDFYNNKRIIWIDHHPIDKNFIKKHNIIYFNPLLFNEKNLPVCYWVSIFTDYKFSDYALIGSISDFFVIEKLFHISNVEKLFHIDIDTLKKKKYNNKRELIGYLSYESSLRDYISFFNFIFKFKSEDLDKAIIWLQKKSFNEVITDFNTGKNFFYNLMNQELKKVKNVLKKIVSEKFDKILYYEYSGKTGFTSIIINELCYKLNNDWKIIILCFINNDENTAIFSIRSNEIVINDIVSEVSKKFNTNGGGHLYACGASIDLPKKDDYVKELLYRFNKII